MKNHQNHKNPENHQNTCMGCWGIAKRKEFSINTQGLRRHTTQYDPIYSNNTISTSCNDTISECRYSSCKMMLKRLGPEILEPRGLEPKWLRTIQQYLTIRSYVYTIIWSHDHMITKRPLDFPGFLFFPNTPPRGPPDDPPLTPRRTYCTYTRSYFLYPLITHMIWLRSRYSTKWSILMV